MNKQSLLTMKQDQKEVVISNVVRAVQILYTSVKERKEKEFVEKIIKSSLSK